MKYIIGAGVGGLFGLSVPFALSVKESVSVGYDESPREEVPQHAETDPPASIDNAYTLPDDSCRYMDYNSEEPKEQVKECLEVDMPALPAI